MLYSPGYQSEWVMGTRLRSTVEQQLSIFSCWDDLCNCFWFGSFSSLSSSTFSWLSCVYQTKIFTKKSFLQSKSATGLYKQCTVLLWCNYIWLVQYVFEASNQFWEDFARPTASSLPSVYSVVPISLILGKKLGSSSWKMLLNDWTKKFSNFIVIWEQ